MPELPDVEVFRQYLNATSLRIRIESVEVRSRSILKGISARRLRESLEGHTLETTRRHGKYLFVQLDNKKWLVFHFGMSGRLTYFKEMEEDPPYDRFLISFSNGYHLAYDSQRKLGKVELTKDIDRFIREKGLGPDALASDFEFGAFETRLRARRGMLKSVLMNQEIMAGIGNATSDEILYQSRLHPKKKVSQLDKKGMRRLFRNMKKVLSTCIDCRATPEEYPKTYITPHRKAGATCPKCGGKLGQLKLSGHITYHCPDCQGHE
jgi:formamidopyrimidine-DNA glycosylase